MSNTKVETKIEFNRDQLLADHKTVSGAIRFLTTQGLKRGEIAKILNIRYQHVRNVQLQPLKKST